MKVLFVCSGNAYRSPLAEALLKKIAPNIEADSAGVSPMFQISESTQRFLLRENAVEELKRRPEGLWEKELNDYDLIVAMEREHMFAVLHRCPECARRIEVWDIDDPYSASLDFEDKIFQQIKAKVKELARCIKAPPIRTT